MDTELLKIFDENGKSLGTSTREEVHNKGLWHETFHCWFVSKVNNEWFIHFQLRSKLKKDYPNTLDISAAGHINADESVADGIREVYEELGINLTIEDLISLGNIPDEIIQKSIIDRELGHVFLYVIPNEEDIKYNFGIEEVSGIFKIELGLFEQLWLEKIDRVQSQGIVLNEKMENVEVNRLVRKGDFLPHDNTYILKVLKELKNFLLESN
ncbi:NUDIX hydrolase [Lysinibacillus sp. 2017]|uniref:NUDIX hydrolase n=1 Tax=unclassified Lysinibacillus TaxID=2636778 RepID=UPI000D5281C4|nr:MULTISPECIES: NUDIX hydrolase [unclassified Lysinibacillus]AWE07638.1 NUDIX hydrolase [Lysinibacillus sp. 2017]TGN36801.1 NUDIX hydrolase [Lysinibacillus sp. S2017]